MLALMLRTSSHASFTLIFGVELVQKCVKLLDISTVVHCTAVRLCSTHLK